MIGVSSIFDTLLSRIQVKKQGYTQKFISLSLIVISIFWVATFQLCEMLFLFILVLIQLMGSALLKKLSYSRQK